jgi:hypothetical protein
VASNITGVSLPSASIQVRGPSGRLYGEFDPHTGIITFKRGQQRESIDLTPYLKIAKINSNDNR